MHVWSAICSLGWCVGCSGAISWYVSGNEIRVFMACVGLVQLHTHTHSPHFVLLSISQSRLETTPWPEQTKGWWCCCASTPRTSWQSFQRNFASFHIRRILLLTRACLIWNVKALTSRLFQQWEYSPNIGGKFAKFGWQLYLLALLINSTCSQTLGMESGTIQNYQISAASSQSSQVAPDKVSCCRIK